MKLFALLAVAAIALTGCSQTGTAPGSSADLRPSPSPEDESEIRRVLAGIDPTLDNAHVIEASRRLCVNGIMEGPDRSAIRAAVQKEFGEPNHLKLTAGQQQAILEAVLNSFCHA